MTLSPEQQAVLQALDGELNLLVLVRGELADGSAHYAYVSMPLSRYPAFKEAEAAGNYDLADFGTILAHGPGDEPPADVRQRMEREHGANHRLESELQEILREAKGGLQG